MAESSSSAFLEEQDRWLKEAASIVKRNSYFMRKAIDDNDLKEAMKYAANLLAELRTSQLSPQKYYELYMQVFDELNNLEVFFESYKNKTYKELYQLVQHAGFVLPRLYLMVAVGYLFIKSGDAKPKDILKDLVEMCKGVQHPIRGLFLRSYLCQRSRTVLPDTGSKFAGEGGDIHDALDFLLSNFIEMNKLWVRMQHQGSLREREKREKERQQLQDLVGRNLTYLSQLDGLDFELYSNLVLPRVLEQVVSCKDDIAQQYLMQCVIQGFPDQFHLATLDSLLGALPELQSGVKVHALIGQLMDRLGKYALTEPAVNQQLLDTKAFDKFKDSMGRIMEQHVDMMPADAIEMFVALMNFTNGVYPSTFENVNQVLGACYKALHTKGVSKDTKAEKQLVNLLTVPLDHYDVVTVLGLSEYPVLMNLLTPRTHKDMAVKIVQRILTKNTFISTVEKVDMLFSFITPLVEQGEASSMEDYSEEDWDEEQILLARLLHQLQAPDIHEHFRILRTAKQHLCKGGLIWGKHTLPPLVFCTLQLVCRLAVEQQKAPAKEVKGPSNEEAEGEEGAEPAEPLEKASAEQMLQWLLETCLLVVEVEPIVALRLLLCCAHAASEEGKLELLAYDFFERAFTLYEESIADSRAKSIALHAIIGTLQRCYIFTDENRDALVQQATSYSSKLLKRADQCRAVCSCSHLYWQSERPGAAPVATEAATAAAEGAETEDKATEKDEKSNGVVPTGVRDAQKVMMCLSRAIKIAHAAKQQIAASGNKNAPKQNIPLGLYVEILNHYLYYFDQGHEIITTSALQQLLELVHNEILNNKDNLEPEHVAFWKNTVKHIKYQKQKETESKQKYAGVKIHDEDISH